MPPGSGKVSTKFTKAVCLCENLQPTRAALRMKFLRCPRLLCYLGGVATLIVLSYYSDGYVTLHNLSYSGRVYQLEAASDEPSFARELVSVNISIPLLTYLAMYRLNPVLQKAVVPSIMVVCCNMLLIRENRSDLENQQHPTHLLWKIYIYL